MKEAVLKINVTDFKARCLALFKELEAKRYDKVVVTRRGKPIAELSPAQARGARPLRLFGRARHHSAGSRSHVADTRRHT
jgi:antitoxin (DNA-binding transcriptional repressor) of toxin-antitoxin stability system